ncbi:PLDc N-terminal domain-containing protein [Chryseobacterium koreense]|uniref:PLDc N-terminal domain-containing protein n=1 Tax=Chryseobacterium koreense TaxID=232216 RepID=UPI00128DDDAB
MIAFIWLLPIFSILFSQKTSGSEKVAWLLAVLFVSWFAWIFYLLLAPIRKKV